MPFLKELRCIIAVGRRRNGTLRLCEELRLSVSGVKSLSLGADDGSLPKVAVA